MLLEKIFREYGEKEFGKAFMDSLTEEQIEEARVFAYNELTALTRQYGRQDKGKCEELYFDFIRKHYNPLKYMAVNHETGKRKIVSHEEALNIALGSFRDNDMTRDMLSIPNNIRCMYSDILVRPNDTVFGSAASVYNLLPSGIAYDEEGNRKEEI